MKLESAERRILTDVWPLIDLSDFIEIDDGSKSIRTIGLNTQSQGTPLVLLHGMGSGIGLWCLNLKALSRNRPVYAIDLLGFGRSSRPKFSKDAKEAEDEFVQSIEEWRQKMSLDKFVLLGHSFGGFLAAAYALQYPHHLSHLILADPWGFIDTQTQEEQWRSVPVWAKAMVNLMQPFNPFSALRLAGPLAPRLLRRARRDLTRTFSQSTGGDVLPEYLSLGITGDHPSGESAFKSMSSSLAWARHPMSQRIADVDPTLAMTTIHGENSWLDYQAGYAVKYRRKTSNVDVHVLDDAGHHVYADAVDEFNRVVCDVCQRVDAAPHSTPHPPTSTSSSTAKPNLQHQHTDSESESHKLPLEGNSCMGTGSNTVSEQAGVKS